MSPTPEDLTIAKDDMIAFIEGHGMSRFHGYVDYEEVQCVMWEMGTNPDGWKDFVELAKSAGAPFLTCMPGSWNAKNSTSWYNALLTPSSPMVTTWKMLAGCAPTLARLDFCNWAGLTRDRCFSVKSAPIGTIATSACSKSRKILAASPSTNRTRTTKANRALGTGCGRSSSGAEPGCGSPRFARPSARRLESCPQSRPHAGAATPPARHHRARLRRSLPLSFSGSPACTRANDWPARRRQSHRCRHRTQGSHPHLR